MQEKTFIQIMADAAWYALWAVLIGFTVYGFTLAEPEEDFIPAETFPY